LEISNIVENNGNAKKSEREICTEIAEKYEMNSEAVRSIWKRHKSNKDGTHGNQLISNTDELVLVGVLEGFSLSHSPLSKQKFL
jgi:hypothetical protein